MISLGNRSVVVLVFLLLTGCETPVATHLAAVGGPPKIGPTGKFHVLYVNDRAIIQTEYESGDECARYANEEVRQLDYSGRLNMANGKIQHACSPVSLVDSLSYGASAKAVLTNRSYPMRFASKEACELVQAAYKKINQSTQIVCP